jgi:hypothetical protein
VGSHLEYQALVTRSKMNDTMSCRIRREPKVKLTYLPSQVHLVVHRTLQPVHTAQSDRSPCLVELDSLERGTHPAQHPLFSAIASRYGNFLATYLMLHPVRRERPVGTHRELAHHWRRWMSLRVHRFLFHTQRRSRHVSASRVQGSQEFLSSKRPVVGCKGLRKRRRLAIVCILTATYGCSLRR